MQVNRAGTAALLLAPLMAAGACSGADILDSPVAGVQITPASGSVRPDIPISVKAVNGKLQNVTVTGAGGGQIEGGIGQDGIWTSRWPLDPGAKYEVTATAFGADGETKTTVGAFQTTRPKKTSAGTVVMPNNKEKVGIGMPVKLHFDQKVTNKVGVERALEVRSSEPVEGAWHWFDDHNVVFRTKDYWPAHTNVQVIGHTAGVRLAKDVYGKNINLNFKIGDAHETVGSAKTHYLVVRKNGKKVRRIAASMGMGGIRKYTTTNGIHLALEKEYMTVMTSPGIGPGSPGYYSQNVYWTVKISDSGEYVHGAPWSVGSQGHSNVSHGCVNIATSNAKWFHRFTYRGDPIRIKGTNRQLEPENGWGYWQLNWKSWLSGSKAKAVTTSAPDGGAFPGAPAQAPKIVTGVPGGSAPAAPESQRTVKS